MEAVREAEVRSTAAKMPIAAYRCDACGNAHLCKAENARAGSILTRPEPELPLVLGNADAKRKVLRDFLGDRTEATTDELIDLLEVGRKSVGSYMQELKWHNTRGRHARWVPDAVEVDRFGKTLAEQQADNAQAFADTERQRARHLTVVEGAKSRHPSSAQVGWEPMLMLDTIRHVPLGDVIDMLAAMGRELRIQTREKP